MQGYSREDFSNLFTTLLNSHAIAAGFGSTDNPLTLELDEYEKSVFLTLAQEEFTLDLYNGKAGLGGPYEKDEETRRYLANLVCDAELTPIANTTGKPLGVDSKSKFFTLPDDPEVWTIVYEKAYIEGSNTCKDGTYIDVVPVRHNEYNRLRKNPFRGPNSRRALRFDLFNATAQKEVIEIVSTYPITKYYLRYLKKPEPIILIGLPDGLTIEGEPNAKDCKMHPALHKRILERAVVLALQYKGIRTNENSNAS